MWPPERTQSKHLWLGDTKNWWYIFWMSQVTPTPTKWNWRRIPSNELNKSGSCSSLLLRLTPWHVALQSNTTRSLLWITPRCGIYQVLPPDGCSSGGTTSANPLSNMSWDVCYIIFCHLLHIHSGKTGILISLLLCSIWWVQIVGYVFSCLYITPSRYHHCTNLYGDIELMKRLSDIFCRVCE